MLKRSLLPFLGGGVGLFADWLLGRHFFFLIFGTSIGIIIAMSAVVRYTLAYIGKAGALYREEDNDA